MAYGQIASSCDPLILWEDENILKCFKNTFSIEFKQILFQVGV